MGKVVVVVEGDILGKGTRAMMRWVCSFCHSIMVLLLLYREILLFSATEKFSEIALENPSLLKIER